MEQDPFTPSQPKRTVNGTLIASIILGILVLVLGSVMIWALVAYNDQKNNVEQKIFAAVEQAKNDQKDKDQDRFDEKEKDPMSDFVGPVDLGRVSFKYPKIWSMYIDNDGSKGDFKAYLNPGTVPPTSGSTNKFALQVQVVSRPYDSILQQYSGQVKNGQLRSSEVVANGYKGQRFDGKFSTNLEGSIAVFKIRDKSLILETDSTTFQPDFDNRILKTLTFDQ